MVRMSLRHNSFIREHDGRPKPNSSFRHWFERRTVFVGKVSFSANFTANESDLTEAGKRLELAFKPHG